MYSIVYSIKNIENVSCLSINLKNVTGLIQQLLGPTCSCQKQIFIPFCSMNLFRICTTVIHITSFPIHHIRTCTMFNPYPAGIKSNYTAVFTTSIEPDQPAHPCSLTRLYTIGWPS